MSSEKRRLRPNPFILWMGKFANELFLAAFTVIIIRAFYAASKLHGFRTDDFFEASLSPLFYSGIIYLIITTASTVLSYLQAIEQRLAKESAE